MIVLSMMVAIGVVAWPSLRRPMADSSVQQAANDLRLQIADCRQTAAIQGQPRLMRFEAGLTCVGCGPWNDLVVKQLTEASSIDKAIGAPGGNQETKDADSWELPIDIVVDEVQMDQRTYVEAGESFEPSASGDPSEAKWYLPFLPSGQTRDAVIVLRDLVTGSRVALEIEAVTGLMRTHRLTSSEPRDATEMANKPPKDRSIESARSALKSQSIDRAYSR